MSKQGNHVAARSDIPRETYEKFLLRCDEYGVKPGQVMRLLVKDWTDGHIVNKHNQRV